MAERGAWERWGVEVLGFGMRGVGNLTCFRIENVSIFFAFNAKSYVLWVAKLIPK